MVPRVDTAEQAREAVSFMRYPPDGTRGARAVDARRRARRARPRATSGRSTARILGIIQIESPSAVEHAAEIAAIDGVDVLFVGPTDLSHSLGVPGQFDDPSYLDALGRVAAAAEAAGKAAGILLYDAAVIARHRELGFRFIGLGADGAFVADGARAVLRAAPTVWRPTGPSRAARDGAARAQPSTSASRGVAGSGAPLGRGEVWAITTPTRISPAPTSWIGARRWSRNTNDRTTMKSGSTVLTSAAWAAPIRRAPA